MENEKLDLKYRIACLPKRFLNKKFNITQNNKEAYNFAKEYTDNINVICESGQSVIFMGKVGVGKTHLATAIAKKFIEKEKTVKYKTIMDIFSEIKATWKKDTEYSEETVISNFSFEDLLIVDEVGVQFNSETEKMLFFRIINQRYNNCLPTILISNLGSNQIKSTLGERTYDRLKESNGKEIVLKGTSQRK